MYLCRGMMDIQQLCPQPSLPGSRCNRYRVSNHTVHSEGRSEYERGLARWTDAPLAQCSRTVPFAQHTRVRHLAGSVDTLHRPPRTRKTMGAASSEADARTSARRPPRFYWSSLVSAGMVNKVHCGEAEPRDRIRVYRLRTQPQYVPHTSFAFKSQVRGRPNFSCLHNTRLQALQVQPLGRVS